jgi:hypothetical protein
MMCKKGVTVVFEYPHPAVGQVAVKPFGGRGGNDSVIRSVKQQDRDANGRDPGANVRIPQVFQPCDKGG